MSLICLDALSLDGCVEDEQGRFGWGAPEDDFLGALSNSGPAVRLYSEGRAPAHQIKQNQAGLRGA